MMLVSPSGDTSMTWLRPVPTYVANTHALSHMYVSSWRSVRGFWRVNMERMQSEVVVGDDIHLLVTCFLRELALMTGGPSPLEQELSHHSHGIHRLMERVVDKLNAHADPGTRFGELECGQWGWLVEVEDDEQDEPAKGQVCEFRSRLAAAYQDEKDKEVLPHHTSNLNLD